MPDGQMAGRFEPARLAAWVAAVLTASEVPQVDARLVADALVDADLRGVDTHGLAQLPPYVGWLQNGSLNPRPQIVVEGDGALLRVEGDRGLGQVVVARALEAALDACARYGIAAAALSRTGHLGALGSIVRRAAEKGKVALVLQNGPPLMGLEGMQRRAIGNNPLAFAAPVVGRAPIVFDVATSEVAFGKIARAVQAGAETVPKTWAMDETGVRTDDARAAAKGILLAMGGSKGIGLAMMVEVLAGSLNGTVPVWGGSTFGGFLLVVDPEAVGLRRDFDAHLTAWLDHYLQSGEGARYPGERAAESYTKRSRAGLAFDAPLAGRLNEIGRSADIPFPQPNP